MLRDVLAVNSSTTCVNFSNVSLSTTNQLGPQECENPDFRTTTPRAFGYGPVCESCNMSLVYDLDLMVSRGQRPKL